MKCAVAIVLALIGMAVANPGAPIGLGYAAPPLLPSAVSVSSSVINHGYRYAPIISAPLVSPVVPVLHSVPLIKTPVLTAPLTIGYPGIGYRWGGLGYGGVGLGKGLGYAGLGYGGLGWSGVGIGKGWH